LKVSAKAVERHRFKLAESVYEEVGLTYTKHGARLDIGLVVVRRLKLDGG